MCFTTGERTTKYNKNKIKAQIKVQLMDFQAFF